jgi:hypothetical protein
MKTHIMRNWRDLCQEAEAEAAPPKTPRLAHQIARILTAQLAYLKTRQAAAESATDPEPA